MTDFAHAFRDDRSSSTHPAAAPPSMFKETVVVLWLVVISTQHVTVVVLLTGLLAPLVLLARVSVFAQALRLIWPFLILMAMGLVVGASSRALEAWPFLRDAIYLLKAPLILLTSFGLARWLANFDSALRTIFYASCVLAVEYLIQYGLEGAWTLDRRELQLTVGRGYYLTFFGLMVAVLRPQVIARPPPARAILAILGAALIIAATIASTSRGILLCPVFFLFSMLVLKLRLPFRPILFIGILAVAFFSLPPAYVQVGGLLNILDTPGLNEMLASEFGSMDQIRNAFRSYEAHLAWEQFSAFTPMQKIFGLGFGSLVELTVSVQLGVSTATQSLLSGVPITHISMMTAMIKFGLVGTVLYMLSVLNLGLSRGQASNQLALVFNHTATLLTLFVVWTFQGYFSTLDLMNIALAIVGFSQASALAERAQG
ncbi:MAG: hypothetical protein AAF667_19450 [Pseudomonadota bacterium]